MSKSQSDQQLDRVNAAIAKYNGANGPAEKKTFKDAGLAARARMDRNDAKAEITLEAEAYLALFDNPDPYEVDMFHQSIRDAMGDDEL